MPALRRRSAMFAVLVARCLIEHAWAVASRGGHSILDPALPRLASTADRPGVEAGDAADLVLVAGDTVASAVMDRPSDRTVLRAGRVVADRLRLVRGPSAARRPPVGLRPLRMRPRPPS